MRHGTPCRRRDRSRASQAPAHGSARRVSRTGTVAGGALRSGSQDGRRVVSHPHGARLIVGCRRAHRPFSSPQCGSRDGCHDGTPTRSHSRRVLRTPYRLRNRPATRRYGLILKSARVAGLAGRCHPQAWWQPPSIRTGTVPAAPLPQRHHGGRRAVRHPHCASLFRWQPSRPPPFTALPVWQPRRFAPSACLHFKERPARPFGDRHRLFAPLKTPGIKAGTVHRRYRRLMPLP